MPGRLAAIWTYVLDYLRNALWVVPALLILGAVALAYGALSGHWELRDGGGEVWWYHSGSAADASALLETLLSSMISMTALVVSIMVVVLTLAANQLGPRLIWTFASNRRTQVALGVFIATITYLLLILRSIDTRLAESQVPHLGVTLGSALSLTCIGVLLFFVHHLTRSIIADAVIRQVGNNLDKTIAKLPAAAPDDGDKQTPVPTDSKPMNLSRGGYVQVVKYDRLARCAAASGAVLYLEFRAGDYLLPQEKRLHVAPAGALSDSLATKIDEAVILGSERTSPQDIEFGFRQLVEIGLRALSPGVNDPFTAIAVIHRLAHALALMLERPPLPRTVRDADGVIRVHSRPPAIADLAGVAFNQLRHAAEGRADVLTEILWALAGLRAHAQTGEHRRALDGQTEATIAAARRGVHDPGELARLEGISSVPTGFRRP